MFRRSLCLHRAAVAVVVVVAAVVAGVVPPAGALVAAVVVVAAAAAAAVIATAQTAASPAAAVRVALDRAGLVKVADVVDVPRFAAHPAHSVAAPSPAAVAAAERVSFLIA